MTTLLQSTQISENDKICLHFALGKIYDDCREFDQAFGHYQEGNTIKRKSITPDKASQEKLVKSSIRLFTTDFFSAHNGSGSQSDKPIFIVGMPRSGTTLVEQILSSHPHIHGAGETSKIRELSEGEVESLRAEVAKQNVEGDMGRAASSGPPNQVWSIRPCCCLTVSLVRA